MSQVCYFWKVCQLEVTSWCQRTSFLRNVQFSLVTQSRPTLGDCSTPGFPFLHLLPELAQTHVCWVCDAIQPSHPLLFPCPPALNLSQHQGLFQWVGSLHQVDKVSEVSFSISPSNEYSGLISFRIDWFDLFAVQGTLKSLLQHQFESINSSVLSLLYGPTLTSIHDYWKYLRESNLI